MLAAPGVVTFRDGGCRRRSLGDASLHDPMYVGLSHDGVFSVCVVNVVRAPTSSSSSKSDILI